MNVPAFGPFVAAQINRDDSLDLIDVTDEDTEFAALHARSKAHAINADVIAETNLAAFIAAMQPTPTIRANWSNSMAKVARIVFSESRDLTTRQVATSPATTVHIGYVRQPDVAKSNSEAQTASLFPGEFVASRALISIWIECIRDLAGSSDSLKLNMTLARASSYERSHAFAQLFRGVIGEFAQYARYLPTPQCHLVLNGRIDPSFQVAICDRFSIIPDRASEFMRLLADDLIFPRKNGQG